MTMIDLKAFQKALNNLQSNIENEAHFQDIRLEKINGQLLTRAFQGHSAHISQDKDIIIVYKQTEIDELNGKTEDCESVGASESVEGSPLRLQRFDTSSQSPNLDKEYSHIKPITLAEARYLLSLCNQNVAPNGSNCPIWIYCDGCEPDNVVFLASHVTAKAENTIIHTYKVLSKGPYSFNSTDLPRLPSLIRKHFPKNTKVQTKCLAEYDVFCVSKEIRDVSLLQQQQGSLALKVEWEKASSLLQNPPLDARTQVEASVSSGDIRSSAYAMYTELMILQGLTNGLKEGIVEWTEESEDQSMISQLKKMLEELKQGDYSKKPSTKSAEEEPQSPLKNLLLIKRKNLDFTEELWDVLKESSSTENLVEGLEMVFSNLVGGQLQPMVNKSNKTQLAHLVRDSYYGKMVAPKLEGLLPLQLLVDIGIEKLQRDYANAFIGKDLVTGSHLEYFIKPTGNYEDKLERLNKLYHALELVVMLEQYLRLPKASLGTAARHALKHYETSSVDEKHVFKLPVQTSSVSNCIERSQPVVWKMELHGTVEEHNICTSYMLSTRPSFTHKDRHNSLSGDIEEDISTSYYMMVESQNVLIL